MLQFGSTAEKSPHPPFMSGKPKEANHPASTVAAAVSTSHHNCTQEESKASPSSESNQCLFSEWNPSSVVGTTEENHKTTATERRAPLGGKEFAESSSSPFFDNESESQMKRCFLDLDGNGATSHLSSSSSGQMRNEEGNLEDEAFEDEEDDESELSSILSEGVSSQKSKKVHINKSSSSEEKAQWQKLEKENADALQREGCEEAARQVPVVEIRSSAVGRHVHLAESPFSFRMPSIVFPPGDKPYVNDPQHSTPGAFVTPSDLRGTTNCLASPQLGKRKRIGRKGKFANLLFCFSEGAVRHSAVLNSAGAAGFMETDDLDEKWSLRWAKRVDPEEYFHMDSYQKVNHFPGTWGIGRKDNLHRRLTARLVEYGAEHYGFFPQGYLMPREVRQLVNDIDAKRDCPAGISRNIYIIKPVASACGRGISLIAPKNGTKIPKALKNTTTGLLVQKYIHDPLLIYGYKFDLRIYVVVTSYDPLRIYVYEDGLVRMASSQYPTNRAASKVQKKEGGNITSHQPTNGNEKVIIVEEPEPKSCHVPSDSEEEDDENEKNCKTQQQIDDDDDEKTQKEKEEPKIRKPKKFNMKTKLKTAHLTNYSVNKENTDGFVAPTDNAGDEEIGSKWTISTVAKYFQKNNLDWPSTWKKIEDVIIKTLLCVEADVISNLKKFFPGQHAVTNCFELYGFDVLLRDPGGGGKRSSAMTAQQRLSPVLMEVNIMPSLNSTCSLLDQRVKGNMIADLLTLVGPYSAEKKHKKVLGKKLGSGLSAYNLDDRWLNELRGVDQELIIQTEEENDRCMHWKRIFPTLTAYDTYKPFIQGSHPKNILLQEWEEYKTKFLKINSWREFVVAQQETKSLQKVVRRQQEATEEQEDESLVGGAGDRTAISTSSKIEKCNNGKVVVTNNNSPRSDSKLILTTTSSCCFSPTTRVSSARSPQYRSQHQGAGLFSRDKKERGSIGSSVSSAATSSSKLKIGKAGGSPSTSSSSSSMNFLKNGRNGSREGNGKKEPSIPLSRPSHPTGKIIQPNKKKVDDEVPEEEMKKIPPRTNPMAVLYDYRDQLNNFKKENRENQPPEDEEGNSETEDDDDDDDCVDEEE